MPAGANDKREREFKKLEKTFKKEHRYAGREEEVAARIVNKQRAQYGETVEAKREQKGGISPDRNLPLKDYRKLTIPQITSQLDSLSGSDIRQLRTYEIAHKNRKGVLAAMDRLA